jgi:NAD+ kinase
MLLPDSMELRVCVPYNSRSTAWASFDGRGRIELKQGDHIKITASKYPFPTVCADKQSTDWFSSISRTLRWNERERQKSFVVVEEEAEPAEKSGNHAEVRVAVGISKTTHVYGDEGDEYDTDDEDEDEDFEEFEEEFDIDDRSGGDETPSPSGIPPPNSHPQRIKSIMENAKSGVNSPDRFASGYRAPPPLSQRHLLERLATVENQLRQAQLDGSSDTEGAPRKSKATNSQTEDEDEMRTESDATLYGSDKLRIASVAEERRSRSESTATVGESHTPRQGRSPVRARSRNRNNAHSRSRSHSPAVGPHGGSKSKAFAFFGQDDSTSELSDHSF